MNIPKLEDLFVGTNIYINEGIYTDIEAKGQGMQRAMIFTILRAYAQLENTILSESVDNNRNIIFGIEEPELYLHPQSQRTLMSVFREIANKGDQVICSTQSSLFVDINYFDQICIMRREKLGSSWESYSTQLQMSAIIDDLRARKGIHASEEGIREQYSNAFNPIVNEGFFADKVVIVEGPSEQYALPIYADMLNYNLDKNNISIVHSDGKGQMDRLFRIFNEFRIPTYLMFDGDKDTKDPENRAKTLELLELVNDHVEDIMDIETKITGRYAIMEYNFEETVKKELSERGLCWDEFIKDATKMIGPCGKPLKHRFIANRIKQKINEGAGPVDVIPTAIIEIVGCIQSISYNGTILKS